MKRRTTAIAVVMLALAMIITGCDPSASGSEGGNASAASMMKAMSQAVASAGTDPAVSGSGSILTVTDFTADDGTRISGTIERDAEGNIISARLSFINPDGTAGPELVLATESGSQDVTYDDKPVNPDQLPQPMTLSQRVAFGGFLEGFEEAFDEIEDLMDDILEHYEDNPKYGVGTYQIDGDLSSLMQGTVTIARERGDDAQVVVGLPHGFERGDALRGREVEGIGGLHLVVDVECRAEGLHLVVVGKGVFGDDYRSSVPVFVVLFARREECAEGSREEEQ